MKMEAMERRGKIIAVLAIMTIVFWSQCKGVEGYRNVTKMSYVCPPHYIRLGHSCYFFSENKATWQNALFSCKDNEGNLTVPARWEDRNLRNHLNKPNVEQESWWIGGIYDYGTRSWRWGGELKQMKYQSFSKMKRLSPEELQWHCIAMMPELLYRWAPKSCIEPRKYICQTKLRKVPKSKVKELRKRWQRMGKINEINAPAANQDLDPRNNDVTANPISNFKSYDLKPNSLRMRNKKNQRMHGFKNDLRPNELMKRSKPRPTAHRKLTKPFPGYTWNRGNPEGSFSYNADLLRSGKTGLSPQQVKTHLARLAHLRDRQMARRERIRNHRRNHNSINHHDWLVNDQPMVPNRPLDNAHPITYTIDNNISALHPKTIVEEFNMMPPPPVVYPRSTRGAGYGRYG